MMILRCGHHSLCTISWHLCLKLQYKNDWLFYHFTLWSTEGSPHLGTTSLGYTVFSYPRSMLPLNLFYGKMFHSKVVLLLCMYIVHYYQRAKDSMRKSGKLAALFPPQVLRGPFQQRKSTTEVVLYAWVFFTASYIFFKYVISSTSAYKTLND